jgi:hypothetical protein
MNNIENIIYEINKEINFPEGYQIDTVQIYNNTSITLTFVITRNDPYYLSSNYEKDMDEYENVTFTEPDEIFVNYVKKIVENKIQESNIHPKINFNFRCVYQGHTDLDPYFISKVKTKFKIIRKFIRFIRRNVYSNFCK